MPIIIVSEPVGNAIYQRIPPKIRDQDLAATGGLRILCLALGAPIEDLAAIITETDDASPWTLGLDADNAPVWILDWALAGLAGVQWQGPPSEALRTLIKTQPSHDVGKPSAIRAAAAATLTGTKHVTLLEAPAGDLNALTLRTLPSETPDAAVTVAATLVQTPAWILLTHLVSASPLIDECTRLGDACTVTGDAATLADVT